MKRLTGIIAFSALAGALGLAVALQGNAGDRGSRAHPPAAGHDGNSFAIRGTAHGASMHGELELLVRAGLEPAQALEAATALPASRFGIGDRGRIAPGMRADLLLVEGDPLADITATRAIAGVWKNGYPVDSDPDGGRWPVRWQPWSATSTVMQ